MAWSACNDMQKIWSSQLPNTLKIKFLRATIESILLYGSETGTLSRKQEIRLGGTYTHLLGRAQSLSWKSHPYISQIYDRLPRVSALVKYIRVQLVGQCFPCYAEVIASLLLCRLSYGQPRWRTVSFPDVISRDTCLTTDVLKTLLRDKDVWCGIVQSLIATKAECCCCCWW